MRTFELIAQDAPEDIKAVPAFLTALRDEIPPDHPLAPYVFLLMQAGSFGGKPIYDRGGRWVTYGFNNDHWMPPPREVFRRLDAIVRRALGVCGIRARVEDVQVSGCAYFDPPYIDTATYGQDISRQVPGLVPCFVSERVPLNEGARRLRDRRRSVLTPNAGDDRAAEYLSLFNADWPTPDYERAEQMALF